MRLKVLRFFSGLTLISAALLPVEPQRRKAKFGVLGVHLSSFLSCFIPWDCGQLNFLVRKSGHVKVPEAHG